MVHEERVNCFITGFVAVVVALIFGYFLGHAVALYQRPTMVKEHEARVIAAAIDSMAVVAKARAENTISCGKCHGED